MVSGLSESVDFMEVPRWTLSKLHAPRPTEISLVDGMGDAVRPKVGGNDEMARDEGSDVLGERNSG